MATPLEQLDLMRNLRPNWDGYGADPTDPAVIEVAKEFVRLLAALRPGDPFKDIFVAPGRAGGVQVEWSDARAEHELEIEPDGTWGFLHIDKATGQMSERRFGPVTQAVHPELLKELQQLVAA